MELWFRDEVLVFVGTLGACGLLALGVLELIWPSRKAGEELMMHRAERLEPLTDRAEVLAARR